MAGSERSEVEGPHASAFHRQRLLPCLGPRSAGVEQRNGYELEKLSEMRTRGLLSEAEFVAAKQRLLGTGQPEKSIGFH